MKAIHFVLELREPLLAPDGESEPNSAVSGEFLPGSALRGAFIAALRRGDALPGDDIAASERRLFDGSMRFLNGYPLRTDGDGYERALPLPVSLREDKYGANNWVYDEAAGLPPSDDSQWQRVAGMAWWRKGEFARATAARWMAIHTARNREKGRAIERSGAVFRYDALAAERDYTPQVYEAVVLCDRDADAALFHEYLPKITHLGGSRNGGYGRVSVPADRLYEADVQQEAWRESPLPLPDADTLCIAVLLSDAVLYDDAGQPSVSREAFARALCVACSADECAAFLDTQVAGGFNRKWGLPLVQESAIRRGSVLALPAGALTGEQMTILERTGIGARRADGFGRVTFLPLHQNGWKWEAAGKEPTKAHLEETIPDEMLAADDPLALLLRRRLAEQRLETWLRATVGEASIARHDLSNSQIGRLRQHLQAEMRKDAPNASKAVTGFFDGLRDTARRQWERARNGQARLSDWLPQVAANPPNLPDFPIIGGAAWQLSDAERSRWVLRFLDAILARAAKPEENA